MKTRIATVMLLLGMFLSTASFASEPIPANSQVSKELREAIRKKLYYPQFAIDSKTECSVYAKIIVNENGRLEVDRANSSCEKMKDFTVKTIEKIKSDDLSSYSGQWMLMKITYDLR
ncbi:MAG: hypothetical protein GXO88_13345 [Chlorobi bacterium]|nr:hypothetical protein [Chlorobiota bacterium]